MSSPASGDARGRSFWEGHRERVRVFSNDLKARGLRRHCAAPPLYRFLWLLRIPVKPPLFQSFREIALTMGSWFALAWGGLMQLFSTAWPSDVAPSPFSALVLWTTAVLTGALFGLTMAAVTRRKAHPLNLPPWDRYPAESVADVFR